MNGKEKKNKYLLNLKWKTKKLNWNQLYHLESKLNLDLIKFIKNLKNTNYYGKLSTY